MAFYKGTHVLLVSTDSDKNWQVSSCWCVDEYPQKPSQGSRILQVRWLPELLNFYFVVPLLQKYKLSKSRSHLTSKMRDGPDPSKLFDHAPTGIFITIARPKQTCVPFKST
jgi:hypothetical protein